MRFLFVDRIEQIEAGRSIVGLKAFTSSEDFLGKHFEEQPLVPGAMLIEAMAQALGWLVAHAHGFRYLPILSIVEETVVPAEMQAGFKAEIHGEIRSTSKTDSMGWAEVTAGGRRIALAGRLIYSHFAFHDPARLQKRFARLAAGARVVKESG